MTPFYITLYANCKKNKLTTLTEIDITSFLKIRISSAIKIQKKHNNVLKVRQGLQSTTVVPVNYTNVIRIGGVL